jgi:hypothetical protein
MNDVSKDKINFKRKTEMIKLKLLEIYNTYKDSNEETENIKLDKIH